MSRIDDEPTRGFRPSARRRNRIAAGVALGAAAIGGNVAVYTSLDDTTTVVQAVQDIPAGEQITPDMVRTIDVELDDSVLAVPGAEIALVPGQYAKVRIVSGSLVVGPALQTDPLVGDGASVVAIEISRMLVPIGVRERSSVELVYLDANDAEVVVPGRTVGLPVDASSGTGAVSLSIEVDATAAAGLAIADDVRVVLLAPAPDEAGG